MKQYYLVWNPTTGYTKYQHNEYRGALNEAKRLASINRGQEFVVLCSLARAKSNDVLVEEVDNLDDHIPF